MSNILQQQVNNKNSYFHNTQILYSQNLSFFFVLGNVHVGNILGTEETYVNDTAMGCAIGLCFYGDEQKYGKVNDVYVAFPGQSRVLISQTGRIGKQGGVRGDVLSHIDGKDISGMDVKEALALLQSKERQGECIMLTLNAELSVAEALKRRAMAISKI